MNLLEKELREYGFGMSEGFDEYVISEILKQNTDYMNQVQGVINAINQFNIDIIEYAYSEFKSSLNLNVYIDSTDVSNYLKTKEDCCGAISFLNYFEEETDFEFDFDKSVNDLLEEVVISINDTMFDVVRGLALKLEEEYVKQEHLEAVELATAY